MINNSCNSCSKLIIAPRGLKYISIQGKETFYCTRRCYVFAHDTRLSKKKLSHLSTLRIKKNTSKPVLPIAS